MTGGTGANTPAIMMEFNVIFQGKLQQGLTGFYIFKGNRFQAFLSFSSIPLTITDFQEVEHN